MIPPCRRPVMIALAATLVAAACGCGTTREHQATEQLVLSDAVDRSVSTIDFRPLSGEKVYLDTSYLRSVKGPSFVNADYVISSLRQQMIAAGCLLYDSANEADLIVEARMGALGADNHRVTYGLPENNTLQNAATLVPNGPRLPVLPEIAFARRESREGAAKVAAFAYDRETRQPVWQSGISQSIANARDTWVLGVGPFRGGTIRQETTLAGGGPLGFGDHVEGGGSLDPFERPPVDYTSRVQFQEGWPVLDASQEINGMIHHRGPTPAAGLAGESDAGDGAAEAAAADADAPAGAADGGRVAEAADDADATAR